MIRIAVCDDDKKICAQIENILLDYSSKNCLKIAVDVFYSGESLVEYIKGGNTFDLIYLDIEMGELSGIEVGRQLRKVFKDYSTEIVYISGKDGYDRQLFDFQPLHFIPKPIREKVVIDDLKLALERAQKLSAFFQYQKGYDTYKIPINEIIYFESVNREIKIVTVKGNDIFYGSLEDTELKVSSQHFLHIHRSYLINYEHISILRYKEVIMSNGETIPISRSKRQMFRNIQLNDYS